MSSTLADVNKAWRAFIRTNLQMPADSVKPANHVGRTSPQSQPFATLLLSDISPTGKDDCLSLAIQGSADFLSEVIIGQRLIRASVQFFGDAAVTQCHRLSTFLGSERAAGQLRQMGFGLVNRSAVRDLSATVDATWENRASLDVTFHAIASMTFEQHFLKSCSFVIRCEHSTKSFEVQLP